MIYGPRELLAVALVTVVGVGLLARPSLALRTFEFTHGPDTGRRGPFGAEPEYSDRACLAARVAGAASLLLGVVVLVQPLL